MAVFRGSITHLPTGQKGFSSRVRNSFWMEDSSRLPLEVSGDMPITCSLSWGPDLQTFLPADGTFPRMHQVLGRLNPVWAALSRDDLSGAGSCWNCLRRKQSSPPFHWQLPIVL